jgi:uncharacterized membrane protein
MDSIPLILVLISALSHGTWNYISKVGRDKEFFMLLLNIMGLIITIPVFYHILPEIYFPVNILPYFLVSAVAETLYFLGLGKAYEEGDLSLVYPVARSSPVFVAVIAFLFLGEDISAFGVIAILVIFFGVYILHLEGLTREDLIAPIKYLSTGSSRYALLAAFGTTIYSITDKLGVTTIHPFLYSFWLGFFVTGMLAIAILYHRGFQPIKDELKHNALKIALAGVLMRGGYMMVLYAMSIAQVSYILSLRQVSVVLGTIMGVIFLKESYGKVRIIGSFIIFMGVYILGALA